MNNFRVYPKHPSFRRSSSSDEDSPSRRPGAGGPRGAGVAGVKRALFGPSNREENLQFANQEIKRHVDEASARWNFDFLKEQPMEGRYIWKMEPSASDIAATLRPLASSVSNHPALPPEKFDGQTTAAAAELENRDSHAAGRRIMVRSSGTAALPGGGLAAAEASPLAATSAFSARFTPSSSSSSSFTAAATTTTGHLAGSPAGSLDDLRTPAALRGPEAAAAAAAARLSDLSSSSSTAHSARDQGARPKTKEQKITDAFKLRKSRSKSSSRMRLKRLEGPLPVLSRSPSVSSGRARGGGGAHRSPPAATNTAGQSGFEEPPPRCGEGAPSLQ